MNLMFFCAPRRAGNGFPTSFLGVAAHRSVITVFFAFANVHTSENVVSNQRGRFRVENDPNGVSASGSAFARRVSAQTRSSLLRPTWLRCVPGCCVPGCRVPHVATLRPRLLRPRLMRPRLMLALLHPFLAQIEFWQMDISVCLS